MRSLAVTLHFTCLIMLATHNKISVGITICSDDELVDQILLSIPRMLRKLKYFFLSQVGCSKSGYTMMNETTDRAGQEWKECRASAFHH